MTTSKKILSFLTTAAFLSGAFIGSAHADNLFDQYGDATGNRPLSIRQQQEFNAKALRDAANSQQLILKQVGNLNAEERVSDVRQQESAAKLRNSRANKPLLILPFLGDWNGTAKAGFPHQ